MNKTLHFSNHLSRTTFLRTWQLPLIAAFVGAISVALIAHIEQSILSTTLITATLFGIGALLLRLEGGSPHEQLKLQHLFLITLGFRLGWLALSHTLLKDFYGPAEPFFQYVGGDEQGFMLSSEKFMLAWREGRYLEIQPYWSERPFVAYLHILGMIRAIGDYFDNDTIFNIKLLLCTCSALIVPYTYKIALRLVGTQKAQFAALFSFWMPDYWYFGATIMRDILVAWLVILVLCYVIELLYHRFQWWRLIFVFVVNFGLLANLRAQQELLVGVCVLLLTCITHYRRLHLVVALAGVALAALFILISQGGGSFFDTVNAENLEDRANIYVEKSRDSVASDSLGANILALPAIVRGPLSAIQLILLPIPPWGPFQYFGANPRGVIETITGVAWYLWFLRFLPAGFTEVLRRKEMRLVWLWGPVLFFALALGVSGGILIRWRLMIMPFLLILAAIGYLERAKYSALNFITVQFLLVMLTAYLVVKYII